MSWVERIKSDLIIQTGDSKQYRPLWMNATKAVEYNIAEFEFPELAGTLVSRGTPKGAKYNLEIFFQGENHLEDSLAFETSAIDKRAWVISHPFYGNISVQPTSLLFDNTKYNVSKITGTVIETITEDNPKVTFDPIDKITEDSEACNEILAESFANDVKPNSTDINTLSGNVSSVYKEGAKSIKTTVEADTYFNLFNEANSAVLNATAKPLEAIRAAQAVISYPSLLKENVTNRLTLLVNQFTKLRDTVDTLLTKNSKKIYENNAGTIISAMALTTATPLDKFDYDNKNSVLRIVEIILNNYNAYLADIDSLQSLNGGKTDNYIPDATSLIPLNLLVNYTISNLFNIALNSKQERAVLLETDSNLILLAHRFYGLEQDDSSIDEIIRNNDIGINEMLQVKKGRKIIYYV